jgi:hypothetical protein
VVDNGMAMTYGLRRIFESDKEKDKFTKLFFQKTFYGLVTDYGRGRSQRCSEN